MSKHFTLVNVLVASPYDAVQPLSCCVPFHDIDTKMSLCYHENGT